jgi:predicted RNA-binding Zn ribbon-like protein
MARKPAPGRLELVAEFVNTLDVEVGHDAFRDPQSLATWLSERGLLPDQQRPVTDRDLADAIALREALRGLLAANNGIGQVDLAGLNARSEDLSLRVVFSEDGGAVLRPKGEGVRAAASELIGVVFTAMTDGTWSRLKACREDSCRWAYYDRSKNRSGAWCSMEVCGNRAKARAYRARGVAGTA